MVNKNGKFHNFSMDDAARLAESDAAKQLFAHLQQQNSDILQQAMQQASAGNLDAVKQAVSQLLADPQTAALLGKLKE